MTEIEQHRANRLLAAMSDRELARLAPSLDVVSLNARRVLVEPGARLQYGYFPHAGVICLMAVMGKAAAETATVGPEGFIGFEALLGGDAASQRVLVQIGGTASRLPMRTLLAAAHRSALLRCLLLGYVRYFITQVSQSVACNGLHSAHQRCARWLLMAHDRARTDSFKLTHDFLAEMLGIQRPSVNIVARRLQSAGLIRYSRGEITIVNRKGLEMEACECYAIVSKALEDTLSPPTPAGLRRNASLPSELDPLLGKGGIV